MPVMGFEEDLQEQLAGLAESARQLQETLSERQHPGIETGTAAAAPHSQSEVADRGQEVPPARRRLAALTELRRPPTAPSAPGPAPVRPSTTLATVWQVGGAVALAFCVAALFSARPDQQLALLGGAIAAGSVLITATIVRFAILLRYEVLRAGRER
jgi:hypothetical protein